ncbi:ABC transporter ATP-binding protein [Lentibacter algarum]|uniref:ABC transporter ATP-binding protein n=1 Tax=Lentibacter algarum TaxID=576131 RepID=UPI001C06E4DB|nr:ABC transporter ATP-binding protein [Lentibacter algarum]MBU2980213.1 ABC transporter ATP-binding protein [Lentibacter algarum]
MEDAAQQADVKLGQPDFIQFKDVTKKFGDFTAVQNVSLDIREGEIFCLLGGSGSGKSTLLRMLAGFETITDGRIILDGEDVAGVPPERLPLNMMFQSYALFPHMSVERNVGYGLRRDGVPKAEIATRVAETLELVKLTDFAKRKPSQLSGGQRQRVALARCIVKKPKVLLLDEPLGALDKKLREETQQELLNIQRTLGLTFIIVTHDQEEAMTMADRIGVMNLGQIVQVGPPRELYEQPNSLFIADFVGALNRFDGVVTSQVGENAQVRVQNGMTLKILSPYEFNEGERVKVTARPEKLSVFPADSNEAPTARNALQGQVTFVGYMGDQTDYRVMLDGGVEVKITEQNHHMSTKIAIRTGDKVRVDWPARSTALYSA